MKKKCFLVCSKDNYKYLELIAEGLDELNYKVIFPNSYSDPYFENGIREKSNYQSWKASMLRKNVDTIRNVDFLLVVNIPTEKGDNYIGGATFTEMYEAFRQNKPIFTLNSIVPNILYDEMIGIETICLNGNIKNISE